MVTTRSQRSKEHTKHGLTGEESKTVPSTHEPRPTSKHVPSKSHQKSARSLKRKRNSANKIDSSNESAVPKKDPFKQEQRGEIEKRLRPFRKNAPKSFLQKLERAQTQRMVVIGRNRTGRKGTVQEAIDIVGSTGNIYKVTIGKVPACTCPDGLKGNECKHKIYALYYVLKASEHLQYQRAFVTSELEEIFDKAPAIPSDTSAANDTDGKRKPIEGECPICYTEFDEDIDELVWCKAACGNNMHKSCFDQWAASRQGHTVKCVYCRTDWIMDGTAWETVQESGDKNTEGYVNVAEQFGISRARDYSSYYQPWVRQNLGYG